MTNAMKNKLPNLKHMPYGGAWSIHDSETVEYVSLSEPAPKPDVKKFLNDYAHWMKQGHTLDGIDAYKHLAFANGTTEVMDKFYMQNTHRRLRLWKGEYFYHQIVARENFYDRFAWIDDGPILDMDVVVVSLPFANTGGIPEDFDKIINDISSNIIPLSLVVKVHLLLVLLLCQVQYLLKTSLELYHNFHNCKPELVQVLLVLLVIKLVKFA